MYVIARLWVLPLITWLARESYFGKLISNSGNLTFELASNFIHVINLPSVSNQYQSTIYQEIHWYSSQAINVYSKSFTTNLTHDKRMCRTMAGWRKRVLFHLKCNRMKIIFHLTCGKMDNFDECWNKSFEMTDDGVLFFSLRPKAQHLFISCHIGYGNEYMIAELRVYSRIWANEVN